MKWSLHIFHVFLCMRFNKGGRILRSISKGGVCMGEWASITIILDMVKDQMA